MTYTHPVDQFAASTRSTPRRGAAAVIAGFAELGLSARHVIADRMETTDFMPLPAPSADGGLRLIHNSVGRAEVLVVSDLHAATPGVTSLLQGLQADPTGQPDLFPNLRSVVVLS